MALYGGCGCEEYCRHDEEFEDVDMSCKVCGRKPGAFYRLDGEIVGCDECLETVRHHDRRMELLEEKEAVAYAG